MRKIVVWCAVAIGVLAFGMGPASAGEPAVQGCVGESVSATTYHPYGREFVYHQTPLNPYGTFGDAVQALQAGLIPDGIGADNTCNDG